MSVRVGTRLEKVLDAGHFAVTAEVGPPMGANPLSPSRKLRHHSGVWGRLWNDVQSYQEVRVPGRLLYL